MSNMINEKAYETIGENSTQRLTKKELIEAIERTFPENEFGAIAMTTTTKFGDYHNPIVMQSITFGKPLEF